MRRCTSLSLSLLTFSTACSRDEPPTRMTEAELIALEQRVAAAQEESSPEVATGPTTELLPGRVTKCVSEGCRIWFNWNQMVFAGSKKGTTTLRYKELTLVSKAGKHMKTETDLDLTEVVDLVGVTQVLTTDAHGELPGFEVVGPHGIAKGSVQVPNVSLRHAITTHFRQATYPTPTALEVTGTALVLAPTLVDEFGFDYLGTPSRLSEVRFVANVQTAYREAGSCGRYRDSKGKSVIVKKKAADLEIRIYDLKTGTLATQHTIKGPTGGCGDINFGGLSFGKLPNKKAARWIRKKHTELGV